jgi:hypothetical protein
MLTHQNRKTNIQSTCAESCSPVGGGGRLKRILSSLAREWLRITNGLLTVEDPEPALRSPNRLMRVNGARDVK